MKKNASTSSEFDDLSPELLDRFVRCREEFGALGLVLRGTVIERWMPCGKPGCRCQATPPLLHGPYYQWTTKIEGMTKTLRIRQDEVEDFRAWIAAGKYLDRLVAEWRGLSLDAIAEIRAKR